MMSFHDTATASVMPPTWIVQLIYLPVTQQLTRVDGGTKRGLCEKNTHLRGVGTKLSASTDTHKLG